MRYILLLLALAGCGSDCPAYSCVCFCQDGMWLADPPHVCAPDNAEDIQARLCEGWGAKAPCFAYCEKDES